MTGDRPRPLRLATEEDPVWRLWRELPPEWRGPVIGPGIDNWEKITELGDRRIDLTGLPELIAAELAWMAHWQALDGTRSSVLATNQFQARYNATATPFDWRFTRSDLDRLLDRIAAHEPASATAMAA